MRHAQLRDLSVGFKQWYLECALPLWWARGADHARGGFYEAIDFNGAPVEGERRLRVLSRQIIVFAVAGQLKWKGPWRSAIAHGLDSLLRRYRRSDGLFRRVVQADGSVVDDTPSLYEQAFVLLALANAYPAFEQQYGTAALARNLLDALEATHRCMDGGFLELSGHPMQSNAHMHLLEAMLAWAKIDKDPRWLRISSEIVKLCLGKFLDADRGYIREYFTHGWRKAPGRIGQLVEPGHQFEWSSLLNQWSDLRQDAPARLAAARLYMQGESGIDTVLSVVRGPLRENRVALGEDARLWSQTEWLRSSYVAARCSCGADEPSMIQEALVAGQTVRRYLNVPIKGLWHERMRTSGEFVNCVSKASSLYHLASMLAEMTDDIDLKRRL